jgi:hypothetical protein
MLLLILQETSYPYHSIEGQMRALADLAYLLGQYEFAVQSYRLAAQDYLAAPNSRWYAGAEVSSEALSLVCRQKHLPQVHNGSNTAPGSAPSTFLP